MSSQPLYLELMEIARDSVRQLDHDPIAGRLMRGTLPAATYVRYLAQVRRQICGSAPMLEHAGRRLRSLRREELSGRTRAGVTGVIAALVRLVTRTYSARRAQRGLG